MTQIVHQDVFSCMEQWAPKSFAYHWDPVGLQTGSKTDQTQRVLVSLDVTVAVVDEAIAKGCNLIIAHHPLLFKALQSVDTSSVKGRVIQKLIKNDITVYAAHTNLDIANGGVNEVLVDRIGLKHAVPLIQTNAESLLKLVVFVPKTHTDLVRKELGVIGAGHIGAYSHCTYQTSGVGTFKPLEGTNPYIGTQSELTFVEEDRIETIIQEKDAKAIIEQLQSVHPYEEVAFDLYPVKQTAETYGLGRIGVLPEAMTLESLSEFVKERLNMTHVRFVGNRDQRMKQVAIIGGSGEKYIEEARRQGADVLITGDMTFHPAQDAMEAGFSIIDAGHYVEQCIKPVIQQHLIAALPQLETEISEIDTDPFTFI